MNKNKLSFWIIIIIVILGIHSNGYYNRNIRVDDIFLDNVAQCVIEMEDIRKNNKVYTSEDDFNLIHFFGQGEMANKSNPEIDIAFEILAMSEHLYMYNDEKSSGTKNDESEQLKKYFEELEETRLLLETYREKNNAIESLWTKNIFN